MHKIIIFSLMILFIFSSCDLLNSFLGESPTPAPTPIPTATPIAGTVLKITALVSVTGSPAVNASHPIYIVVGNADYPTQQGVFYSTTVNGGTIVITNPPSKVLLGAIFVPTGQFDPNYPGEHTDSYYLEYYNNMNQNEIMMHGGFPDTYNVTPEVTQNLFFILEDRNWIPGTSATPIPYTIETYADASSIYGDTILELHDSSMYLITTDDNSGQYPFAKISSVTLLPGQTYYILVYAATTALQFGYAISVYETGSSRPLATYADGNGTTPDGYENSNDTSAGAESIYPNECICRNLEMGDLDWFKITIPYPY